MEKFIYLEKYYKAVNLLSKKDRMVVNDAIVNFMFANVLPEGLSKKAQSVWDSFIFNSLKLSKKNYQNSIQNQFKNSSKIDTKNDTKIDTKIEPTFDSEVVENEIVNTKVAATQTLSQMPSQTLSQTPSDSFIYKDINILNNKNNKINNIINNIIYNNIYNNLDNNEFDNYLEITNIFLDKFSKEVINIFKEIVEGNEEQQERAKQKFRELVKESNISTKENTDRFLQEVFTYAYRVLNNNNSSIENNSSSACPDLESAPFYSDPYKQKVLLDYFTQRTIGYSYDAFRNYNYNSISSICQENGWSENDMETMWNYCYSNLFVI